MKQLCTIFLLLTIFSQTFNKFVVEADYFINKSYIAKVLCINKEKPKMHCNGKCYLAKQLKEQEQQEQQAPNPKREKFEVQPFFLPQNIGLSYSSCIIQVAFCSPLDIKTASFPHSVFRPPSV